MSMARSISWNCASRAGNERCAKFMASLHQKEKTEVALKRQQDKCAKRMTTKTKMTVLWVFAPRFFPSPCRILLEACYQMKAVLEPATNA